MQFTFNDYQSEFMWSTARFPCMKGGWATGKRLSLETEVKVPGGWKNMGDIEAGDLVYGFDGRPTTVLIAHEIVNVPVAYRLQFDNGESVLADPCHLWYTVNNSENRAVLRGTAMPPNGSIKTTQQIVDTIRTPNNYASNHQIPIPVPFEGIPTELPIKPYTLGAWLGDGDSNGCGYTCEDPEIIETIRSDGYIVEKHSYGVNRYSIKTGVLMGRKPNGRIDGTGLFGSILHSIGVRNNKHIPRMYLEATVQQRRELLYGLMDTDGTADIRGACEFTTTIKALADDFIELANGLGLKPCLTTGKAKLYGRVISNKYRIHFRAKEKVFRLSRKQARIDQSTDHQLCKSHRRMIVGYVIEHDIPMRCLTVDAEDGLFCVTRSMIPTHNTLCGIVKIWLLANMYKDNLLLVCRENFRNLFNSTIKDFTLYTKQKVKVGAKECELPNGTHILFSHADDIAGVVQNINLGGFLIEQAEEFDTSDVFTMLAGGRMRRKLEIDERFFELTDKEWAKEPPRAETKAFYDYVRSHSGDYALNQGIVIANANGRNWVWHSWRQEAHRKSEGKHWTRWEKPPGPRVEGQCECEICKGSEFVMWDVATAANNHNLKPDFRANHERMKHGTETEQRKYRMYVLNLDDEVDLEGAYYAQLMAEARRDGRIGKFQPDGSAATHTVWDLGIGDTTAIWFIQKLGHEIRHVCYYENNGEGIEHYVRYLESVRKRLKLHYGRHFWPHDGRKRDLSTGKELHKTAEEMGLDVTFIDKEKRVEDGIERTRKMIPDSTYDEIECRKGIDALEHYQRKKNQHMSTEEKTVFQDSPLHDWASNGADSERYVSKAIRKLGGTMSVDRVRELMKAYT